GHSHPGACRPLTQCVYAAPQAHVYHPPIERLPAPERVARSREGRGTSLTYCEAANTPSGCHGDVGFGLGGLFYDSFCGIDSCASGGCVPIAARRRTRCSNALSAMAV